MIEDVVTVVLTRDVETRVWGVVVRFPDGVVREVRSPRWTTRGAALAFADKVIGSELERRTAISEVP